MSVVRLVEPASEPVEIDEAKTWCRVDGNFEDATIAMLISAARIEWERETRRSFVTQTWRADFDRFPIAYGNMPLPYGPVQSVTSVHYYDELGADTTLDAGLYRLDLTGQIARIWLTPDEVWPIVQCRRSDAVRVTYVAGYGAAADVPQDIKLAIVAATALWFDNRALMGDVSGICGLLSGRKVQSLA